MGLLDEENKRVEQLLKELESGNIADTPIRRTPRRKVAPLKLQLQDDSDSPTEDAEDDSDPETPTRRSTRRRLRPSRLRDQIEDDTIRSSRFPLATRGRSRVRERSLAYSSWKRSGQLENAPQEAIQGPSSYGSYDIVNSARQTPTAVAYGTSEAVETPSFAMFPAMSVESNDQERWPFRRRPWQPPCSRNKEGFCSTHTAVYCAADALSTASLNTFCSLDPHPDEESRLRRTPSPRRPSYSPLTPERSPFAGFTSCRSVTAPEYHVACLSLHSSNVESLSLTNFEP